MPPSVASSPAAKYTSRTETAQTVFDAPLALRLWHLASLDAPTVAVVWTLAFAWASHVAVPTRTLLLVALVTWSVYVTDRLLDAWRGLRESAHDTLRDRHFFHWRHRGVLLPLAIMAAGIAAEIFFSAARFVRARDSLLGVAALAYFSGVHSGRRPLMRWPRSLPGKELLVGGLFTAGCAVAAWEGTSGLAGRPFWIPAVGFAALAWLNCTAIAHWELNDASNFVRTFALALAGLEIALAAFAAIPAPRSAALFAAAAMSALLLSLVDCARTRMTPLAVRSVADLALLTPAPLLVVAWAFR